MHELHLQHISDFFSAPLGKYRILNKDMTDNNTNIKLKELNQTLIAPIITSFHIIY